MKIDSAKLYQELNKRTEFYAAQVRKIYDSKISEIIKLCDGLEVSEDEPFKFSNHKDISPKVQKLLRGMYSEIYKNIRGNIVREWNYSNIANDKLVHGIFGKNSIEDNHFAQYFQRNKEAMNSFFARKTDGLDLSKRVWKYTGQAKEELELALDLGLGEGLSADELSRVVRNFLHDPDVMYRRFKISKWNNESGENRIWKKRIYDEKTKSYKWINSDPKSYHPGRGVYRSSYKNAQRLTRTETNMAYRSADTARWEQLDFVTGYEVKLSNNHPVFDICDDLQGKYPKTFKFVGWHPNCRCNIVPILCSEKELEQLTGMILDGEDTAGFAPKGIIEDVPDGFTNWVNEHSTQINAANKRGTLPYFLKDNAKFAGIFTNGQSHIQVSDEKKNTERTKELRSWAKEHLVSKTIHHNELNKDIRFTVSGIKEYLNQPHSHYYEKNELIKDIQNIVENAEYKGIVDYNGRISHIFEIEINGDKSWIIANEYQGRGIILYSISDSAKVLTDIKK